MLDKTQLLELQDYIDMLDEEVDLDCAVYNGITKAVSKQLDTIKRQEKLTKQLEEKAS